MSGYLPISCLLGIHLTIFTHSGPQVIYHYPPSVVDHLKAKQRQNKKVSAAADNENGQERINDKQAGFGGALNPQLARSSEYRSPGEDSGASPKIELSSSANFRSKGLSDTEIIKNGSSSGADSDLESSSSGLSDSELSTDYIDCSSASSSASGSLLEGEAKFDVPEVSFSNDESKLAAAASGNADESFSFEPSPSSKPLRHKGSQISASKLMDIFRDEREKRRPSHASKVSSIHAGNEVMEDIDARDDLEVSQMIDEGRLNFDEQHFAQENFLSLNKVFDFDPEFVAEFCSPEREMCNTRFEFTVDETCFLGLPIHVDANGQWRKSRRRKHSNRSRRSNSSGAKNSKRGSSSKNAEPHDSKEVIDLDNSAPNLDEGSEPMSFEGSEILESEKHDDLDKSMDMFHVCFVMNPSLVVYNEKVDDMFHYVVARLSLLLRYAQAKSNYVSKQCNIIVREREKVLKFSKKYEAIRGSGNKAKYLYRRILAKSSLARALTTCVDKLQRNEIATLEIDDDKVISLQIPVQNEFKLLPSYKLNPVLRGSFLTSILNSKFLGAAPARENDDRFADKKLEEDDDDDLLHYALLLLDEPAKIIKDLENLSSDDDIGNMVLTHLIRRLQPTVALGSYQNVINELLGTAKDSAMGSQNSFQTSMLRSCALHLLYRRHARVIVPISSKSTYIVSPLAPIHGYSHDGNLQSADIHMERPLIYQNQEIFKRRFPSLPSLISFLNLLSCKKPKPFGSVIPSKEHKPIYLGALTWLMRYGYVTQLLTFVCIRVDKQVKMAVEEDLEKEAPKAKKVTSNREHDKLDNLSKDKDATGRVIPTSQLYRPEDEGENFTFDDPGMRRDYTIILEPARANAIEKRWIFKCIQDQPTDFQILFNRMLPYFNGRTPMELVVAREVISRHELRKVLNVMSRYLLEFHHW